MKDWSRLSRNNGIAQTTLTKWKRDEVELILVKEICQREFKKSKRRIK